ncbi:MAG TPA: hypothetical protein VGD63_10260 [Steroidobacteraceae bacterium]
MAVLAAVALVFEAVTAWGASLTAVLDELVAESDAGAAAAAGDAASGRAARTKAGPHSTGPNSHRR